MTTQARVGVADLVGLGRPFAGQIVLAVLAGSLTIGSSVALMASSAYLLTWAALQPTVLDLSLIVVAVRTLGIARAVFRYLERLISHAVTFQLLARIRVWLYRRVEPLAPAGLDTYHSSDLLSRLVADVDSLQTLMARGLSPALVALAVLVGVCAGVWLVLPSAAVVLAATLLVAGAGVPWLASRLGRAPGRALSGVRAQFAKDVVEVVQGAPDLLAYGLGQQRIARLMALDRRLRSLAFSGAARSGFTDGLGIALSGLGVCGVLLLGIPAVRAGQINGLLLAAMTLAALASFEAVLPLSAALHQLELTFEAARRLVALARTPQPVMTPARTRSLPPSLTVRVESARLRYAPDEPWALDRVSLHLEPGRRVAVVGPSGAGKTSLANVLLRFRDLDDGRVTLGGCDVRDLDQADVRRTIGLVAQDAYLFNTSIEANVRLARPEATDAAVEAALRRARIWDWVASLPQGAKTVVSERGRQLSGGQAQRLALARALLADVPVLILDEPTSNLDRPTARALTRDLLDVTQDRGVLLITHELSDLDQVDEIVVLDRGRVVERGSHIDLVQLGGLYCRLWQLQRTRR
jgi:thiol reductant ABC exporter CydC subunit